MVKHNQDVKRIGEKHLVRDLHYEFYKEQGKIDRDALKQKRG
jgi:hypothetical protein